MGTHGGSIYCWVPPPLVELADRGLLTLPCENVLWLQSLEELSAEQDAADVTFNVKPQDGGK